MAGLIEKKKKDLRERIVAAAGELFNRQGYENTTMDQIADAAVVARKTLYNYFPVKEAIADEYVRSISRDAAQENRQALAGLPDTRSRLIAAINNRYEWLESNPELSRIVMMYRMKSSLQKSGSQVIRSGSHNFIRDILRESQEKGEISPEISIERVLGFIEYMRTVTVMEWLEDNTKVNLREETARLVDLALNGAFGQQQRRCKRGTKK